MTAIICLALFHIFRDKYTYECISYALYVGPIHPSSQSVTLLMEWRCTRCRTGFSSRDFRHIAVHAITTTRNPDRLRGRSRTSCSRLTPESRPSTHHSSLANPTHSRYPTPAMPPRKSDASKAATGDEGTPAKDTATRDGVNVEVPIHSPFSSP